MLQGKMTAKKLGVDWRRGEHVMPDAVQKIAEHRTRDMVAFYGLFIRTVTLDQLAQSCYLQGVEDAMGVAVSESLRLAEPAFVPDFVI